MFPIGSSFLNSETDYSYISISQRHAISAIFEEWINDVCADPDENRSEAVKRIRSFLDHPNARMLDLSRLNLTRLPFELFKIPDFKGLQMLDLSNNRFRELPEGLENMAGLRTIDMSNNQIREVSKEIEQLGKSPSGVAIILSGNPLNKSKL